MKKLVLLFLFMLVSVSAFADPSVAGSNDFSIGLLGDVFGNVGNVLSGDGTQMLGKLFYVLNMGILGVAAVWLAYSVATVALRSSQEGSFMGQNKNVAVLVLRIALGIALTIPMPNGYSVSQVAVMKVVIGGVKLADNTWGTAIDYMTGGGVLYQTNGNGDDTGGYSDLIATSTSLFTNSSKATQGQQIFSSLVCMHRSQAYAEQNAKQSGVNPLAAPQYSIKIFPSENKIGFPGFGGGGSEDNTRCGTVIGFGGADSVSGSDKDTYAALSNLVSDLDAAAQYYVTNILQATGTADLTAQEKVVKDDITLAIMNYYSNMMAYSRTQTTGAQDLQDNLQKYAKTQGWILAGRYYWDLNRLSLAYKAAQVSNETPAPGDAPQVVQFAADQATVTEDLAKYANDIQNNIITFVSQQQSSNIQVNKLNSNPGDFSNWFGKMSFNVGGSSNTSVQIIPDIKFLGIKGYSIDVGFDPGTIFVQPFVKTMINAIAPIVNAFFSIDNNPMIFLMTLGRHCLEAASAIWIAGLVIIATVGLFAGFCSSMSPGGVAFSGLLQWLKPLAFGLTGALIVPGIILGYYLPLYPYLLFTFGSISWIMLVLESMVAAPLVAFGMTHPEGHDFLGRSEQAMLLFLGVFLRPALMVIGMIAAMIISYVAMKLVIAGFGSILLDIAANNVTNTNIPAGLSGGQSVDVVSAVMTTSFAGDNGDLLMDLVLIPALLVIFAMTVYKIMQQCFSLIYELPNNVMQWIGAPQKQDQTAQMVQQIEGVASGAAKNVGDMSGQATASGAETAGRLGISAVGAIRDGKKGGKKNEGVSF